jgi:hypothetical protein
MWTQVATLQHQNPKKVEQMYTKISEKLVMEQNNLEGEDQQLKPNTWSNKKHKNN